MYKSFFGKTFDPNQEQSADFRQLLLMRADKVFALANESSINSEYWEWFQSLNVLKRIVSFKTTEKELWSINKKIKHIQGKLKVYKGNEVEKYYIESKLDEAELIIISLMYKYGLYYPRFKKPKKWQDEAEDEDK